MAPGLGLYLGRMHFSLLFNEGIAVDKLFFDVYNKRQTIDGMKMKLPKSNEDDDDNFVSSNVEIRLKLTVV